MDEEGACPYIFSWIDASAGMMGLVTRKRNQEEKQPHSSRSTKGVDYMTAVMCR